MNSGAGAGLQAQAIPDNTSGETTLTYYNAPALAASGPVTAGTWVALDVSSYVAGEAAYSFCSREIGQSCAPCCSSRAYATNSKGRPMPRLDARKPAFRLDSSRNCDNYDHLVL